MRIKLDENIDYRLAEELCGLGHDAHSVRQEGLSGRADGEVARAAFAEGRAVSTLDLGFGDTRAYPPGRRPGIVVFRLARYDLASIRAAILAFLGSPEAEGIEGRTLIVEPGRIRTRDPEPWDDPLLGPAEAWEEQSEKRAEEDT